MTQNKDLERKTAYLISRSVNALDDGDKLRYAEKAIKSKPDDFLARTYAAELNFYSEEGSLLVAYSHAIKALTQCGLEEKINSGSLSDEEELKMAKEKRDVINLTKLMYKKITKNFFKGNSEILLEKYQKTSEEILDLNNQHPEVLKNDDIALGHTLLAIRQGNQKYDQKEYSEAKEKYEEALTVLSIPGLNDEHTDTFRVLIAKIALSDLKLKNYGKLKKEVDELLTNGDMKENEKPFWESLQGLVNKKYKKKKNRGKK